MNRIDWGTLLYAVFIVLAVFITGVIAGWRLREYTGNFVSQVVEVRIVPADDVPTVTQ